MEQNRVLSPEEYDQRANDLARISQPLFDLVSHRYLGGNREPSFNVSFDYFGDSFGASVRSEKDAFNLTIRAGTFEFLLKRVRDFLYLFDPPSLLIGDFTQRGNPAADASLDSFATALATVVAAALFSHELLHPFNGHNTLLNASGGISLSSEEAEHYRKLRIDPCVRHALEFNADLAAVNWTLDLLLSQPDRFYGALPLDSETSNRGKSIILWGIAVPIIASTYGRPYRSLGDLRTGWHPPAPIRFEALLRASSHRLADQPDGASFYDIARKATAAAKELLDPGAPAFLSTEWRRDIANDGAQAYLDSVGRTWSELIPMLENYKLGSELAFSNEMRAWKKALGWALNSIV